MKAHEAVEIYLLLRDMQKYNCFGSFVGGWRTMMKRNVLQQQKKKNNAKDQAEAMQTNNLKN